MALTLLFVVMSFSFSAKCQTMKKVWDAVNGIISATSIVCKQLLKPDITRIFWKPSQSINIVSYCDGYWHCGGCQPPTRKPCVSKESLPYYFHELKIPMVSNKNAFPTLTPDFAKTANTKFYVDKSLCLKSFLEDNDEKIAFVSAPGYFGKSLTLQMMKHFFEIPVHPDGSKIPDVTKTINYKLFTGKKIYNQDKTFFQKHFGMYPVIFVDYRRLRNVYCLDDMLKKLRQIMWKTFYHHKYLLRARTFWNENLNKTLFMGYINKKRSNKLSVVDLENSLDYLCRVLHAYFQVKPIVLIDEYDAFVHGILFKDNVRETEHITQLINNINQPVFNSTDPIVTKVYCASILHTTGDGIAPKATSLKEYPFLTNHRYISCYGLTEDETCELIKKYTTDSNRIKNLDANIRKLYDGYKLRNGPKMYSVLPVLSFLKNQTIGQNYIATYFASRHYMKQFLHLLYYKVVKDSVLALLRNGIVQFEVFENLSAKDVTALTKLIKYETGFDDEYVHKVIFNFFLQVGYLSYKNDNVDRGCHSLQFPNSEVTVEFRNLLRNAILMRYDLRKLLMINVLKNIDSFSKINCSEFDFKTLLEKLTTFAVESKYAPACGNDFQNDLFAILVPHFDLITETTDSGPNDRAVIAFQNKNNVSFIVESEFLNNVTDVTEEQIKDCSGKAINKIIQNGLIRLLDDKQRDNIVYLGICLSVSNKRLVGLAFSKYFDAGDNLNSITIYSKVDEKNEYGTSGLL